MDTPRLFTRIFPGSKALIGMIHVQALPGTPGNTLAPGQIITAAAKEAEIYASCGVEGIIIENMHDVPYLKEKAGEEITAMMSVIGREVKKIFPGPVGIQILSGANRAAMAAALAGGLDFIRAEAFVFGHIADEGFMNAQAGELLRYRKYIGAEHVAVFTDIKKKHASHHITADISLREMSEAAHFFGSDGIIITGTHTGKPVEPGDLKELKTCRLPVLIGSGIHDGNLEQYFDEADAFIVGSYFKKNGIWQNSPDPGRIKHLVRTRNILKQKKPEDKTSG